MTEAESSVARGTHGLGRVGITGMLVSGSIGMPVFADYHVYFDIRKSPGISTWGASAGLLANDLRTLRKSRERMFFAIRAQIAIHAGV